MKNMFIQAVFSILVAILCYALWSSPVEAQGSLYSVTSTKNACIYTANTGYARGFIVVIPKKDLFTPANGWEC